MKKYHVATGDGEGYYGVNYESYREAEAVLKFSQNRDPQAHIVEEEFHFTHADQIRAMSDEELEDFIRKIALIWEPWCDHSCKMNGDRNCNDCLRNWLQQPAEVSDSGT